MNAPIPIEKLYQKFNDMAIKKFHAAGILFIENAGKWLFVFKIRCINVSCSKNPVLNGCLERMSHMEADELFRMTLRLKSSEVYWQEAWKSLKADLDTMVQEAQDINLPPREFFQTRLQDFYEVEQSTDDVHGSEDIPF